MSRTNIRVKALCVFRCGEKILCHTIHENDGTLVGYRIPGGHMEFGEKAADTLVREMREELNTEITDLRHLGMIENHFVWSGKAGHEIIFVYEADFVDSSFYACDVVEAQDNGIPYTLTWVNPAQFSTTVKLLPKGLANILT